MSEPDIPRLSDEALANDSTRVAVAAGPLAGPVLARVVGIGASRADLPVDRLDDALLLADVIAAHAPSLVPEGRIELTSTSLDGRLELRLGPLRAGGAEKLLDETSGPGRRQHHHAAGERDERRRAAGWRHARDRDRGIAITCRA